MEVIDYEDQRWILLEEGDTRLLQVSCNHSFIGYEFMIELSEEEKDRYAAEGREYLTRVAQAIQNSAPIVEGSQAIYKGREVSRKYADAAKIAFERWRMGQADE